MKLGVLHITYTDSLKGTVTENYMVFNTPKRMFNWIGWKIKSMNSTVYKGSKSIQKSWIIKKIPNGRSYSNVGVKIVAKKTNFYKHKNKEN